MATSTRMGKSGLTYGSAPTFRSAQRAEKRKEVSKYSIFLLPHLSYRSHKLFEDVEYAVVV